MSEFTEHIGGRIRLYRRRLHISVSELGTRISKSKASVSKYESGAVGIDADTLLDIARALGVSLGQLTDFPGSAPPRRARAGRSFLPRAQMYLYALDGRKKQVLRGMMLPVAAGDGTYHATLFLGCPDFASYEKCDSLYYGDIIPRDAVTNYMFVNQQNDVEQLHITAINPLGTDDLSTGLITGINNSPLMPVAFKCLISPRPLPEDGTLDARLRITAEDCRAMKQSNMFLCR